MVTTSYVDFTAGLNTIPDRTDNTGTGIDDLSGREEPLPNRLLDRGGTLTPANAFVPAKGTGDFDVDLGSGTADQDLYVVESDVTGQAPFIIRLEDTNATVTLDAADADDRWDQVWLVVRDATEDGNTDGHTLARLSYRKGDSGTSPSKPGADSEWVHYELIASILVPGGATSITDSDITDERTDSSLLQKLFDDSVRRTAASVFGSVLDSRYLEQAGDTATGNVTWTGGWPTVERTDDSGNTWTVRLDIAGTATDSPRFNIRKNGANYASLQWDETNGVWKLDNGALSMSSNAVQNVADPTNAQDAATKKYVDDRDASNQSDLSDLTHHQLSSTSDSTTSTVLDVTGSGTLLGGHVTGWELDSVTLTVDGTANNVPTEKFRNSNGFTVSVAEVPPVRFGSSVKLDYTTGASTSRVVGQAWVLQ